MAALGCYIRDIFSTLASCWVLARKAFMTFCKHDSILVVWNEDGSLDEVWCGVCELDVTEELGAEIVMEMLQEEAYYL